MSVAIYQIIHLRDLRPRFTADHVARLDSTSRALFGRAYTPDVAQLETRIESLARREGYPSGVSGFVRLECSEPGEERLIALGTSLYEGYALRSLRPRALTLAYEVPLGIASSTAAEAADALARCVARRADYDEALRTDSEGVCYALGSAHLFALRGGELYTSAEPRSVEGVLLLRAAEQLRLRHRIAPVLASELHTFDEVLAVDHRGITALASCDEARFMALRAERLATTMEQVTNAR